MKIDRVIDSAKFVSSSFIEVSQELFAFVHQQADRVRTLQEDSPELSQTASAVTVSSLRPMNVNSLQVDHLRGLGKDVGFKDELTTFTPNPDTALIDPARDALAKAIAVFLQWIDSALGDDHFRIDLYYLVQISLRRRA